MKPDPELKELNTSTSKQKTAEIHSLVLWAANIRHILEKTGGGWQIRVRDEESEKARQELQAFEQENKNWPPEPTAPPATLLGNRPPTVLLMGLLAIFHLLTGPWQTSNPWFEQGAVMGDKILHHQEWWRLFAGLTLHSGPVHLLGNLLLGGVIVHFLCQSLGTGLGWFLLLLSGALGNYLNILTQGAGHNSVGFSTAIFGGIGILTGRQCLTRDNFSLKEFLVPLAAALGLLAFTGSAGQHTDLGAHLFGLLSGLCIGLIVTALPTRKIKGVAGLVQILFFFLCIILLSVTWQLAGMPP